MMTSERLLEIKDLCVSYEGQAGLFGKKAQKHAVRDVNISLLKGEILGVVGESGSGKSSICKAILGLMPKGGFSAKIEGEAHYSFHGQKVDLIPLKASLWKTFRSQFQMVFQDPSQALNPSLKIGTLLNEPLKIHCPKLSKNEREPIVERVLQQVGLSKDILNRFPHEFSGGQKQRIAIARSLTIDPEVLILDEPVSALDVSVQAQILNLLLDLRDQLGLTYIFISHDLSVVRFIADRVIVLYEGKVMEEAPSEELFSKALHPYTQLLLSSIPGQSKIQYPKEKSSSFAFHTQGCPFINRCYQGKEICLSPLPLKVASNNHKVFCHLADDSI